MTTGSILQSHVVLADLLGHTRADSDALADALHAKTRAGLVRDMVIVGTAGALLLLASAWALRAGMRDGMTPLLWVLVTGLAPGVVLLLLVAIFGIGWCVLRQAFRDRLLAPLSDDGRAELEMLATQSPEIRAVVDHWTAMGVPIRISEVEMLAQLSELTEGVGRG